MKYHFKYQWGALPSSTLAICQNLAKFAIEKGKTNHYTSLVRDFKMFFQLVESGQRVMIASVSICILWISLTDRIHIHLSSFSLWCCIWSVCQVIRVAKSKKFWKEMRSLTELTIYSLFYFKYNISIDLFALEYFAIFH